MAVNPVATSSEELASMKFRQNVPSLLITEKNGDSDSVVYTIGLDSSERAATELMAFLRQYGESSSIGVRLGSRVMLRNEQIITNAHDEALCEGKGCAIHHPSDHHMKGLTQQYDFKRGIMMRVCIHGHPHPDPDDVRLHRDELKDDADLKHGCDGCCRVPPPSSKDKSNDDGA